MLIAAARGKRFIPGAVASRSNTARRIRHAVATEVAAFVTQYRAFVLHYANLCATAGGVDVFLLGTELRGLTWLRDAEGSYPFVSALVQLAADVKAILPNAQLTYAADWSEWFGHQPPDGSGDVFFHLDPLWSEANITAVAFDNYWPLSDWRDTTPNIDEVVKPDGTLTAITDYDYLMGNVRGGEGYAWYYASQADRNSQTRSPITDGAYGKSWIYRYKDVWSWWSNQHFNRPGGVESPSPTAWVPQSKPIWFTELGCPSVDKVRTSLTSSTIRSLRKAHSPIFRTAPRIISFRGAISTPCCAFSIRAIPNSPRTAIRKVRSTRGAWSISPA